MILNSDEFIRRTLSLPAIKPTTEVSRTTLLKSLLSLSSKIRSIKSLLITSNKRIAKFAINLIEILTIFIEEIRDSGGFPPPGPAFLSLLDIHVALQKLIFLLHDCTRLDARVWMLVNSKRVAGLFRAVIGSVGVALNGVVLGSGVEDEEVKDYVEFIIKQGKIIGRFQVDWDDIWAENLIVLMLNQLENKIVPDPKNIKRVMDYLGVFNWSDCNKQVKFLENEFGSDPDAGRILSLMVYCRCVVFHGSDPNEGVNNHLRSLSRTRKRYSGFLNPDDFKCPISLEIMVDPVTISSGQTYDRSLILKWLKSGNPICPKTGQKLDSLDLVPNLALKQVIKMYCWENEISLPIPKLGGKDKIIKNTSECELSLAAVNSTKMAADFLSIKLAMGTMAEKCKAAYEIRLLTKLSRFNRSCFVESGAVLYLLKLLLSRDSNVQENSAAALLNLSKDSLGKVAIVDNCGLDLVVRVVKAGIKIETRQYAAAILFYMSSVENCRRLIGNNPDAIPALVELIRVGRDRGKKSGLVSIFILLHISSNQYRVLEAGLVPLLVTILSTTDQSEDVLVYSLAVLSALAERSDGSKAILHARGLNMVIAILCSSSYDSSRPRREHCVSLLLALCTNCRGEVVDVLMKNTSLTGNLYSILTEGDSMASKKAGSLIRILHEFAERSSSHSMPQPSPRGNFIHAW